MRSPAHFREMISPSSTPNFEVQNESAHELWLDVKFTWSSFCRRSTSKLEVITFGSFLELGAILDQASWCELLKSRTKFSILKSPRFSLDHWGLYQSIRKPKSLPTLFWSRNSDAELFLSRRSQDSQELEQSKKCSSGEVRFEHFELTKNSNFSFAWWKGSKTYFINVLQCFRRLCERLAEKFRSEDSRSPSLVCASFMHLFKKSFLALTKRLHIRALPKEFLSFGKTKWTHQFIPCGDLHTVF